MYSTYTIAICDILGFEKLVAGIQLERIIDNSINWLRRAIHHSIFQSGFPENVPTLDELQKHSHIGIAWFSDTILLYTRQDTDECLLSLISTLYWLLFETMFTSQTRLRCGVSYGKAYMDQANSIYVGMAIVEAYHLEKRQSWAGGALTQDAVKRIPELYRSGEYADCSVIPYKVPIKNGEYFDTLAINWTTGIHTGLKFQWSSKSSEPTEKDWELRRDVCEKWRNTKKFHDDVCHWCK